MTVRVCDLGDNNKCQYIGSAETYFEITGMDLLHTLYPLKQ